MNTKPRDNRLILLGLGLVLVWLVYDRQQLRRQLASHGSTANELEEAAAAITASLKDNKTKARELARFYSALGDILKRDRGIVAAGDHLGLSMNPDTVQWVVLLAGSWIVGDSLRETT